ncbi:hypothetical protein KDN24_06065 [Bacillus sp. Bva_UNVM-123]|uniref:hypothetical protein n=1 Tax=Bacillus sp. Bva_UNVM-123 TaxID=2829798 RepID=UPI00391FC780
MINKDYENEFTDENGKWLVLEGGTLFLVDPSDEWKNKDLSNEESAPEPTLEEKLAALEQENSTLKEAQAETNTTLLELMETILMGGM